MLLNTLAFQFILQVAICFLAVIVTDDTCIFCRKRQVRLHKAYLPTGIPDLRIQNGIQK